MQYFKKNKGFSLLEVIISISIISISVFWIYKLINENTKLVVKSSDNIIKNTLFPSIETCINFSEKTSTWIYYLNFWNDLKLCELTWSLVENNLDNIEYIIQTELTDEILEWYNKWIIKIDDWFSQTSSWIYLQKK